MLTNALTALLDSVQGPAYVKDAEGRYLVVNEAMARAIGVSRADIIGRTNTDLVSLAGPIVLQTRERERRSMETGASVTTEVEWLDLTGKAVTFLSTTSAWRDNDGIIMGTVGVSHDVTNLRRAEAAARQQQDHSLVANQLMKTRFLSAASHDLRQPLQAMFMTASALARHVAPEGQRMLMQLESALQAQKRMLDSMLDLSSLDAGIIKPRIERFALATVLEPLLIDLHGEAIRKGLGFSNDLLNSTVLIHSDPSMIGRILLNFVENAIRFTAEGRVWIEGLVEDDTFVISVCDTGIGIGAEDLDLVWNEFYQVGNHQRSRSNGLGLGLPLARRLASMLGHKTWVESIRGGGSRFSLAVPTTGSATANAMQAQSDEPPFLVFVDDDELVRDTFGGVLAEMGYQMIIAEGLDHAMEQLDGHRVPEALVIDYRLRGETGIDVVRALRSRFNKPIPAILLTGDLEQSVMDQAKANDMRLLHKPVSIKTLSAAIETARLSR